MNIGLGLLNVVSQSTASSQNKESNTEKDLSDKEKTILENLYRCRDLELNNLWQKSIFLAPFLILCFTGYGILLSSMISDGQKDTEVLFKYNFLCLALCLVSIIFSMLWIYMFKGSKAQYELCERAITNYEQRELNIPYNYAMGTLRYNEIEFDDNLLSTKAGKFSPSKINIVIGQVSLCLWIICFIFHMFIDLKIIKINIPSGYSFIIGILVLILIFFCHKYIKSSYLSPSNQERYIREFLRIVSKERSEKIIKEKNKDREYIEEIIGNNLELLNCLQKIYEIENKVIPLFTEEERIYLDAYEYLIKLGKIDVPKQEETVSTTQQGTVSNAQNPEQQLPSLASALGIKEKQKKELNKYIGEKYQK
ncbi:MAG: RipA family octameric membrane protein [Capnocytophaga sp.]|uniref:RipA family octameric membrane protein n=1 Tax=Capnocytophaga sp. TaxID=44737 RepID=UPI003FA04FF7